MSESQQKAGGRLKKTAAIWIGSVLVALAVLFFLPCYIKQEAEQVKLEEEILLGDASMVEGVRISGKYHYEGRLFWDTEYLAGVEPVVNTEHYFSDKVEKTSVFGNRAGVYWYETGGYRMFSFGGGVHGGWSISSSGRLSVNSANVTNRKLLDAYEALEQETPAGEKKSRQIFLKDYMDYFPVTIRPEESWIEGLKYDAETWEAAYQEFFKIPVPEDAEYVITVGKNEDGEINYLAGGDGAQPKFSWRLVSAATANEVYFTFDRYSGDGTKMDTSLIPGGFGIYRQPYTIEDGELILKTEELSMVYSLEEENYPYGSVFLHVNEENQLLILIDNEEYTGLQVVDLENMELIQQVEITRPEGSTRFALVARTGENFVLLQYDNGYFALVDRTDERGYAQQFLIRLEEDDPMQYHSYVNENAMDWNGERLVYACYSKNEFSMSSNCNLELTVYDESGKIFHGRYKNSLMAEAEYVRRGISGENNNWNMRCEPRTDVCLEVDWP